MGRIVHEKVNGAIIGIAMDILNTPRRGLDEKIYERPMVIELHWRGDAVAVRQPFPVYYRGKLIGKLVPDLIVNGAIIVDPNVASCFTETHVAQMLGYLNIIGLELALLLNFKNARLEWKRVVQQERADLSADFRA